MRIGIPKEISAGETRVATTPEIVKKMRALGLSVAVERGAGASAHFSDQEYQSAGAALVDASQALSSDIVFKVDQPIKDEIAQMKRGAALVAFIDVCKSNERLTQLAAAGVDAFSLGLIPRSSRAQSMDALSSQSNIAGYRAMLEAARLYGRFFPMLMTSAGSSKPARVIVLGAGVAGLQAIATARRLGAQVWAYDVRPEVKEQIHSLGAKFIELDIGESGAGRGGYARELSAEAQRRQQALLAEELKKADIIVSTALIPCKPAPVLIQTEVVKGMRPGSVIVDLAAAAGGNCPLTEPGKIVIKHDVIICGITNFATLIPGDASSFYARNLFNFLMLLLDSREGVPRLKNYLDDEITAAALVTYQGALRFVPST